MREGTKLQEHFPRVDAEMSRGAEKATCRRVKGKFAGKKGALPSSRKMFPPDGRTIAATQLRDSVTPVSRANSRQLILFPFPLLLTLSAHETPRTCSPNSCILPPPPPSLAPKLRSKFSDSTSSKCRTRLTSDLNAF